MKVRFICLFNFEKVVLRKRYVCIALLLMCAGFAVRLGGRAAFDGTILYNQVIAAYTHVLGAFCIFYMFAVAVGNVKPVKVVTAFAAISYEVYLWHYMFTDGPLRLFGLTGIWIVDCALVLLVSLMVAWGANRVAGYIIKGQRRVRQ